MKAKEIIQALRCCANGESEEECPFTKKYGCDGCPKVSADLIERLTAENAALREKVPRWISSFGKAVFLSREEAEKALQEMEGKKDG